MEFQLSVFHEGHYLSYLVSSTDSKEFSFTLKSAPPDASFHPEKFVVRRNGRKWDADIALPDDFQKDLLQHLKQQKL